MIKQFSGLCIFRIFQENCDFSPLILFNCCFHTIVPDLSFHIPMDVINGGLVQSTWITTTVRGSPGMLVLIHYNIQIDFK